VPDRYAESEVDESLEAAVRAMVTRDELRALSERYAQAVDRRDREQFVGVFVPDATVEVRLPGTGEDELMVQHGHDEIGPIIEFVATYPRTMHMLGQSTYEHDGDHATGEVYCLAHHLDPARNGPSNYVMYIRYDDRYRRVDGQWRIEKRRVNIDWTDRRIAAG
jgi:hypothetical protein